MKLLCILATARAVSIDWEALHPSSSANTETAAAGEAVTFTWTDTHDVWAMADQTHYDSCDFNGAVEVHSTSVKTGDVSGLGETKYYACHVGSHCESGQKVAITWAGTATPAPTGGCPAAAHDSDHDHDHAVDYAGACQLNGNYPLYSSEAEAAAVEESTSGTAHQMGDYWMPDCLEDMNHGDYTGDATVCGTVSSDAARGLGLGMLSLAALLA